MNKLQISIAAPAPPARRRPAPIAPRNPLGRIGKYAIPILLVVAVAWIYTSSKDKWSSIHIEPIVPEETPEAIDSINMSNARFTGIDERDRSYAVTALRAVQSVEDDDIVDLTAPKADIVLDSGRAIAIDAERGRFQRSARLLDLTGAILLRDDQGMEFQTTQASIDLAARTASGDAPVSGTGKQGAVTAEGFRISDDGDRILLVGHVRLIVQSNELDIAE